MAGEPRQGRRQEQGPDSDGNIWSFEKSLIEQEWICSLGKSKDFLKAFSRDQIFPSESGSRTKNKAALQPSSSVVVENLRVLRRDSAIQRFKSLLDQSPGMDWIFC